MLTTIDDKHGNEKEEIKTIIRVLPDADVF
jgi:hypothetical protein